MRFVILFFTGVLILQAADEDKDTRKMHKQEAQFNRQIAKQAAKDRKVLEKQRLKQAKQAAKAAHQK